MSETSRFVAFLLVILVSFPESETANITALISNSPSPSYAVEGKNFTLELTYTLGSPLGSASFDIVNDIGNDVHIGSSLRDGAAIVQAKFKARFRADVTDTRAELTILAVQRSDEKKYKINILPRRGGSISVTILLVVNFSSSITNITGQIVREGGNATLKCSAEGKPKPTIKWTRLSDNHTVTMPLFNISRNESGAYRCTANNGVGIPDTREVALDVQYPVEATDKGKNYSVFKGRSVTFKCPVAGNPEPNITWYNGNTVPISFQTELESRESGCYSCVADNSLGKTINITQCLTISIGTSSTTTSSNTASPSTTHSGRGDIRARMRLKTNYEKEYQDLKSVSSKRFVGEFLREMDKTYKNFSEYKRTEVAGLSPGSVIVYFILYFSIAVTPEMGLQILKAAISVNGTFGRYKAEDLDFLSDESAAVTTPRSPKLTVSASPPWAIIGAVAGGLVLLGMLVGVLIWWVHKQRKYSADTKIHNSGLGRHDDEGGYSQVQGAYAQSGPPAANGTDGAAEQQIEGAIAIPTYAVVYKAKKKKKNPREEVPPVYAEVDKSKKKKKKINDNNLYETFDEPKKGKKPGELLYAALGDFQNPAMSTVSISPQPLPAIKKPEAYERTDYAVITQFLKGNDDGNEDTEMKPIRPSKKKIQGKDNETPI